MYLNTYYYQGQGEISCNFKHQASYLVEFHKHEDSNEVHEGGVKLEGDVGGADVVGGGHDSLHEESQAQREVEAVLCRHSKLFSPDGLVVFQELLVLHLLEENNAHEEETEHAVAEVTKYVVEVPDETQGFPAEVVVVADVLVSCSALLVGETEDHLEDRERVEHADQEENSEVELGLLVDGLRSGGIVELGGEIRDK